MNDFVQALPLVNSINTEYLHRMTYKFHSFHTETRNYSCNSPAGTFLGKQGTLSDPSVLTPLKKKSGLRSKE